MDEAGRTARSVSCLLKALWDRDFGHVGVRLGWRRRCVERVGEDGGMAACLSDGVGLGVLLRFRYVESVMSRMWPSKYGFQHDSQCSSQKWL